MTINISAINRRLKNFGMADRSHFFLSLENEPGDAFIVASVSTASPITLHADFQLNITVLLSEVVDWQPLLGRAATFSVLSDSTMVVHYGVISAITSVAPIGGHAAWQFAFSSPLSLLKLQRHNRVFVETDALTVAKQVLSERLGSLVAIKANTAKPPTQPMISQFHESDYDFVRRILAKEGIILHWLDADGQCGLLLTDNLAQSPLTENPIVLPYMSNAGTTKNRDHIFAIQLQASLLPERVWLHDHNSEQDSDISATHQQPNNGSGGNHELWGLNVADQQQAQALANRFAQTYQWQSQQLRFTTTCRNLQPGSRFELTHHAELSGFYQVIAISVSGSQQSLVNGHGNKAFQCEVVAIPAGLAYCPEYSPAVAQNQLLTAHIAQEVDAEGRYRVKYPFDHRAEDNQQPSPATELMQPFGGRDHGMHFPLQQGTEVAVGSVNGDIDRPIILGALFNARSPSVVTASNARENVIRTRAGHELIMDDQRGQEHIQLATPDALNRLKLDATSDLHQIELVTEEGDMHMHAGKSINLVSGGNTSLEVGGDHHVEVAGEQRLLTDEGDIVFEAGASMNFTAAQALHWEANEGDLRVHSGGDMHYHSAGQRYDRIDEGNYQVDVVQGDIELSTGQRIQLTSDDSVRLTVGGSTLQLNGSNLIIDTANIELNADDIAVRAGKVGNN